MQNKIFYWIDRNKDTDNILINLLKLLYSLSFDWIQTILNIFIPLITTYYLEQDKYNLVVACIIVLILLNIWYKMVDTYRLREYDIRKNTNDVLREISVLFKTFDEYYISSNSGKGIFEYASNMVSNSMYDVLKSITKCEIRLSVIQQFHEHNKQRKCMMVGRRSKNRRNCNKNSKIVVKYNDKNDYFYLKILEENDEAYIILDENQINEKFCSGNKKRKQKIYQYIGITEKVETDDIAFLIQIDAMRKKIFGKNNDDIQTFIDSYILPYIMFLRHAYIIESTIQNEVNYGKKG